MFGRMIERHSIREEAALHQWTLGIAVGTLLFCSAFGADTGLFSLDPPSNHWLYQLPEAHQMAPASVNVQAQDEQGATVLESTALP